MTSYFYLAGAADVTVDISEPVIGLPPQDPASPFDVGGAAYVPSSEPAYHFVVAPSPDCHPHPDLPFQDIIHTMLQELADEWCVERTLRFCR